MHFRNKNELTEDEMETLMDIYDDIVVEKAFVTIELTKRFQEAFPDRKSGYPTYKVLKNRVDRQLKNDVSLNRLTFDI